MNKRDWVHLHKAMIMMPAYALCPVSAQEWESQFNPRAAVPAFASFQEAQAKRSAAYRESLNHSQWQGDVPYGPGERQRLDWFKGRAGGPL
ncbi:MAG: hypothetical protein EB006_07430, partial [Betaproteobacteria bacterium]|nr:hypothetical protein [Betaproteobacteria bacterium]